MNASNHDLVAPAQALLDTNSYLTLATADPDGQPWISPVYFASAGRSEFYRVSAADSRHSRNIAGRPQVSLVVFDSTVEPDHAGIGSVEAPRQRERVGEGMNQFPRRRSVRRAMIGIVLDDSDCHTA